MLGTADVKRGLRVDVAISPLMANALQQWSLIYTNNSPWLQGKKVSLNLGASIAAEVARAVTIELDVKVAGARGEFLTQYLAPVLNNIRSYTEYGCAKGGLWLKPYIKGDGLAIDSIHADMGYPIAFDANGNMTAAVFADQRTVGQYFYTRLEYHSMTAEGYRITNTAWKSSVKDMLGNQVSLTEFADWEEIEPEALILNIEKPLFAYFRMPFANNIDPANPLGVSIYSRAAQSNNSEPCLLQQADQMWTDFLWEFESGRRALYTDPEAFKKDTDGKPVLPDIRLYRLLDLQSRVDGKGLFEEWTPTLRETNLLAGLDGILRRIEFACGLSYGVLSNPQSVALTATEIKNSNQRYYATVTDTQKSLQIAFDQLLYAMDVWATLGNLAPAGAYTATYSFDDSIVADHDTQMLQDQQTVTQGAMPKYIFLMRNYKLDEVTAKQWVAEAQAETPAPSFFPGDLGV